MRKVFIMFAIFLYSHVLFADEDAKKLLYIGDHFFACGEYRDAMEYYAKAETGSPEDPEVLWRIGAALNRIAMTLINKARNDTFRVANDYLTKALRMKKDIPEIHMELAWNLAHMGLLRNDWSDFALARRIKEELDYTLSFDSTIADAHFLLGLWHRQVSTVSILKRKPSGLGDAALPLALRELKKSVDIEPENALYRFELANQYLLTGDTLNAIKTLKTVNDTPDINANKSYRTEATKLLEKIERK